MTFILLLHDTARASLTLGKTLFSTYTASVSYEPMDDMSENSDLDDVRRKTAIIHEKLLGLLLDVAPLAQDEQIRSGRESPTQISRLAMREWTENRLADFNLWVTGISVLGKPGVSSSLHLFKPVIESLLTLLGSFLDMYRNSGEKDTSFVVCDDINPRSRLRHTDS